MSQLSITTEQLLLGIFVGGRSSRMGQTKGLLLAPTAAFEQAPVTLVERLLALGEQDLGCDTVLVGQLPQYEFLQRPSLLDAREQAGPLGGFVALLRHAQQQGKAYVLALACDLPYVTSGLLRKLAFFPSANQVLCPLLDQMYQPFFARYTTSCLPLMEQALFSEQRGLQRVLRQLDPEILSLDAGQAKQLRDWDSPADLQCE